MFDAELENTERPGDDNEDSEEDEGKYWIDLKYYWVNITF